MSIWYVQNTVALPWEMMVVLKNQPVTRMPSVRMLALLYEVRLETPHTEGWSFIISIVVCP